MTEAYVSKEANVSKKAIEEMMGKALDAVQSDISKLVNANRGSQLDGIVDVMTREMMDLLKKRVAEASSPTPAPHGAGADGGPPNTRRRPNRR